ncbi:hypothetical protein K438DRAFT_1983829 [Mycena galopus ATCC 62051]|nr:hypothetical protein K438DRAFT_2004138 [Mycena galopus ATCC 62051]KAF8166993.1 hypothetical protein K438DRAFT_1983829 [Mycena galopus ATCC 62051]
MNLVHTPQVADVILGDEVVIQIATGCSDILGPVKPIEMFESFKSFKDLYHYLASVVDIDEDPKVISSTSRPLQVLTKFMRPSAFTARATTITLKDKNFLKEAELADQLLLIIVCDHFNFGNDLVFYLYQDCVTTSIEARDLYIERHFV